MAKKKKQSDQMSFTFSQTSAKKSVKKVKKKSKKAKTVKTKPAKAKPKAKKKTKAKSKTSKTAAKTIVKKRRKSRAAAATAESMAENQRAISISEFFAKNRHLLGFDNPRKALLTAVKEAVDNSLDACEEAHILPDLHITIAQAPDTDNKFLLTVKDNGPGIVKHQHLRSPALWQQVPQTKNEPRPAGNRNFRSRNVRFVNYRRACPDCLTYKPEKTSTSLPRSN
jgi:anti-sigma regulatory factor (Ser/Thr protein kinase)